MSYGESNSYKGGESNSYQGGGYEKPDASQVASYAKQYYQDDDDDDKSDLFGSVLSKVLNNGDHEQGIQESEAQNAARAHEQVYTHENNVSSRDMGSAAAMQAFKMFSSNNSNGGGSSNELVGLAMGEAMKLFNKQGGSASGANQSEMLQSAAMMAMKLLLAQNNGGNGGSSSGGFGQIMGLLGSLGGGGGQQQQQQHSNGIASMLGKFL